MSFSPRLPIRVLVALALTAGLLAGCASLPPQSTRGAPPAHSTPPGPRGSAAAGSGAAPATQGAGSGATSLPSGVVQTTLANGLRVVIVRDALAPVVTQQITYFVGSNQSPPGFPGTAHAQEHMMFRGSPGLTGNQLSEISAQLGGSMDAYTTNNTTTYYFTVPAEDLGLTLKIGALRMTAIDDSAADWHSERGAIEQEVARDNSDPLYVLQARAQAHIFAGTPYAHTGLGTKPSFDKTTAKMLKDFWDRWYAPNNALLVVAGDVQPPRVLSQVKRLFGAIPPKKLPKREGISLSPVVPQTFSSNTDQPYGMVAYVFRMPGNRASDYPAAELLAGALDSSRGPIAALSYEGQALGSGFSYNSLLGTGYGYAWAAFPPGADEKKMALALKKAVEKAAAAIPADLVTAEKRRVLLASALRGNSVRGLAGAWTEVVAHEGLSSPNEAAARLEKVQTTDVRQAARRYLDFSHAVTLELTPTNGAPSLQGGKAFGTPESFGSTPSEAVKLPDWAVGALAKLPHPRPLFRPTVYRLANGIKLIVQPVARAKAVSLFGAVHTNEDLQAPPGEEGVASMLDSLYDWGPSGMTRSEFEAKMGALGADYAVGSGFALQALTAEFPAGLKLLSEDLLDPALPSSAFLSQQGVFARELAGREKSPLYQFNRRIRTSLLPAGDPALRRPTPESVGRLTLQEVRSYRARVMRPDETTIVVMGDVEPNAVKSLIEKYFGSWHAKGPKPDLRYPAIPPSKPTEVFVPDHFREQDAVVLAETIASNDQDPARYSLELGNAYLGGGQFASPLYRELRVRRGLVYSVGSSVGFSHTRASFRISYGASPAKVGEAKQIALRQLEAMAHEPLTAAELHGVKASQLRQIELSNESLGDVAGSWLGYSSEGLPLDRLYETARRLEAVTAAQVQTAFEKYIDPSRLSTFVLGKEPAP